MNAEGEETQSNYLFKKHPASHEFTFSSLTPQLGYVHSTYKRKTPRIVPLQKESHFYTESARKDLGTQAQVCLIKSSIVQEPPPVVNIPSLPTGVFSALLLNHIKYIAHLALVWCCGFSFNKDKLLVEQVKIQYF